MANQVVSKFLGMWAAPVPLSRERARGSSDMNLSSADPLDALRVMGPVPLSREKARMPAPDSEAPFSMVHRCTIYIRVRAMSV
jgi:hypothetical protein